MCVLKKRSNLESVKYQNINKAILLAILFYDMHTVLLISFVLTGCALVGHIFWV